MHYRAKPSYGTITAPTRRVSYAENCDEMSKTTIESIDSVSCVCREFQREGLTPRPLCGRGVIIMAMRLSQGFD